MEQNKDIKNIKDSISAFIKLLISHNAKLFYLFTIASISIFIIFAFAITPEKYQINVGQIAPKTIVATSNIVDTITTEKAKNDAARNVDPVYVSVNVNDEVIGKLDKIFEQFELVEKYGLSIKESLKKTNEEIKFNKDHIKYASSLVTDANFNENQIQTLLNINSDELQSLRMNMESAVRSALNTTIREGNVQQTKEYILQLLGYKLDIDVLQNIASPVLDAIIIPNMVIDNDATEAAREKAMEAVEDVVYQKGQNIVLEGNRIYHNQYQMIKDLGLISDDSSNFILYVLIFTFVVSIMLISLILIKIVRPRLLDDSTLVASYLIAIVFGVLFCSISKFIKINFIPMLLTPILISVLIGSRLAIVGNLVGFLLNVLLFYGTAGMNTGELSYILFGNLIAGFVSVWILHQSQGRQRMLLAAFVAGLINLATMIFFSLFVDNYIEITISNSLACMVSAFLSVLLSMGLQIICENIFNLCTKNKLLELSNTEHPLLRRLLLEAPGTYHHSMLVANLAEGAANSIGADSLLVKVGAYFHDIGKLYRPQFFTENQGEINPHDTIDPYESAEIVIGHVKKGLKMAKENRLPRKIREFISTHHGDTYTIYFYNKALENANGEDVDINKFRYDGPKPHTKEQSILMLADTVEAAVRSMSDRQRESIESEIDRLIKLKIKENQLENSLLSIKDINEIAKSFLNTLSGTYHQRVKYPRITIEED